MLWKLQFSNRKNVASFTSLCMVVLNFVSLFYMATVSTHLFCCLFSIFKAYGLEFSVLTIWYQSGSTSTLSFFNHPIFFIFAPNFRHYNQHLLPHFTVDCNFEWVLRSFPWFEMTILLLESCFFSIWHIQSTLFTVDRFAYEGFWWDLFRIANHKILP